MLLLQRLYPPRLVILTDFSHSASALFRQLFLWIFLGFCAVVLANVLGG